MCLNPCFSGTYSRSCCQGYGAVVWQGLNPCFSGTYSRRVSGLRSHPDTSRLNPCFSGTYSRSYVDNPVNPSREVLILVLVEHTLGASRKFTQDELARLNPCFSGTYSRSISSYTSASVIMS